MFVVLYVIFKIFVVSSQDFVCLSFVNKGNISIITSRMCIHVPRTRMASECKQAECKSMQEEVNTRGNSMCETCEHFRCFLVDVNCANRVANGEAFRRSSRYTWHLTTNERARQDGIKTRNIRNDLPRVISGHLGNRPIPRVTSL